MNHKPFSESCVQNQAPILEVLNQYLHEASSVLEIGSGTGQHAVFFAERFPDLNWQTSDCPEYLSGIKMWLDDAGLDNVLAPIELNVDHSPWPTTNYDAVFSANTVHIMGRDSVVNMFAGIGKVLAAGGTFCLYGPFNYNGQYTSESNAEFDHWLRVRDSGSCIKDFEDLCELAEANKMQLHHDHEMPANNRILVWKKTTSI
jgi:cyclopropane fatty-acyl-phospholipid synthase-like methyltransferase